MTPKQILRAARMYGYWSGQTLEATSFGILKFAQVVAEAEREACADIARSYADVAEPVAWTDRELALIDGMIEVQLNHAAGCDNIPNRPMAHKQRAWDLERVAILRKIRSKNNG